VPGQVIGETTFFQCNECSAIVSKEEVARIVLQMESSKATCPHCGRLNEISGPRFSRSGVGFRDSAALTLLSRHAR
jgi:DNA-directed RNA polymerase subunit RPC12/RpoP